MDEVAETERIALRQAERLSHTHAPARTTLGGLPLEPVYGPQLAASDGFQRIGRPGEFPFTRGLYATGYRGRPWTIRQFAGFGNATQTNERYRMILDAGGGGL